MEKDYAKLCAELKRSLKSKTSLRETMRGTVGFKLNTVNVSYIGDGWYGFKLDGIYFECKWHRCFYSINNKKEREESTVFDFRKNKFLQSKLGEINVPYNKVAYASSMHFGCGCDEINILWVFGEVMGKKDPWKFR